VDTSGQEFGHFFHILSDGQVNFIIIGGVAGIIHGAARLTLDVDIVYERTDDNIDRMVTALSPLKPYLRGAPPGLPFLWDATTIKHGLNFTLTSELIDFDCLGEIAGGGTYADLLPFSQMAPYQGRTYRVIGLKKLIEVKRAAGRPKDFEAISELESLYSHIKKSQQ
jgi:hypothetical protein